MSSNSPKVFCVVAAWAALGLAAPAAASSDWGAIAMDVSQATPTPSFGVGSGDSKEEASSKATKICRVTGAKDGCKVVVTYETCGAVASNGYDAGWATAASKDQAASSALKACGKDNCKLVASDCN